MKSSYPVCEHTQDTFMQIHDWVVGAFVTIHHLYQYI